MTEVEISIELETSYTQTLAVTRGAWERENKIDFLNRLYVFLRQGADVCCASQRIVHIDDFIAVSRQQLGALFMLRLVLARPCNRITASESLAIGFSLAVKFAIAQQNGGQQ